MTLTRGEGGQNKLGSNLFDVLGVLRTLELLAADRYYGVEQRFSRVADFGYSKTPEETFQKWQGHDIALGGHGAGDSNLSSGCAGGAVFGDGSRWAWASSGVGDFDERGVSRGRRSEAVSGANRRGTCSPGSRRSCTSAMCAALGR